MPSSTVSKICGARTRQGHACSHPPGWGTDHPGYGHCKNHGGSVPNGKKHAANLMAAALAVPRGVEPHEALLECLADAAGEVAFFTAKVAELADDQVVVVSERVRRWSGGEGGVGGVETITSTSAELNAWLRARQSANEMKAKFAKAAIDAGVAERQVRVVEQWAQQLGDVLTAILDRLDLTPAQRKRAPEIVRRELLMLEGGRG